MINMHALHNAHLIRDSNVLPRALTKPVLVYENRSQTHAEFAARLRQSESQKRATTKAKKDAEKANDAVLGVGGEGATAGPSKSTKKRKTTHPE